VTFVPYVRALAQLVRTTRDQRDRNKAQTKFWELAGSNLGNVMGVKAVPDTADAKQDADVDYKSNAQFGAAMAKDHVAQSEFAKTKTIQQQVRLCVVCCRRRRTSVLCAARIVANISRTR
jgi:hypothetical protein